MRERETGRSECTGLFGTEEQRRGRRRGALGIGFQVFVFAQLKNVGPIAHVIRQTSSNEQFRFVGHLRSIGKLNFFGVEDRLILQNCRLRQIVSVRLSTVQALIENT